MLLGLVGGFYMSFGEKVKQLRRDKGWTQAELAKHADLKITHIPKLEKDNAEPKLSTIYKLMNALGCSADTLLINSDKIGTDGLLKATLERAMSMPELEKRILIDVIDKYCIACGLSESLRSENNRFLNFRYWTEAPKSALSDEDRKAINGEKSHP